MAYIGKLKLEETIKIRGKRLSEVMMTDKTQPIEQVVNKPHKLIRADGARARKTYTITHASLTRTQTQLIPIIRHITSVPSVPQATATLIAPRTTTDTPSPCLHDYVYKPLAQRAHTPTMMQLLGESDHLAPTEAGRPDFCKYTVAHQRLPTGASNAPHDTYMATHRATTARGGTHATSKCTTNTNAQTKINSCQDAQTPRETAAETCCASTADT